MRLPVCGVWVSVMLNGNLFFEQAASLRVLLYSHDAVDVFRIDNFETGKKSASHSENNAHLFTFLCHKSVGNI